MGDREDRGGPDDRLRPEHAPPDFLCPQMATPGCTGRDWTPAFIDYLYVAFTNASAFSLVFDSGDIHIYSVLTQRLP